MKTKPSKYQSPRSVAVRYLDGEFGDMSITAVAEMHRIGLSSMTAATKREQQKRRKAGGYSVLSA